MWERSGSKALESIKGTILTVVNHLKNAFKDEKPAKVESNVDNLKPTENQAKMK